MFFFWFLHLSHQSSAWLGFKDDTFGKGNALNRWEGPTFFTESLGGVESRVEFFGLELEDLGKEAMNLLPVVVLRHESF